MGIPGVSLIHQLAKKLFIRKWLIPVDLGDIEMYVYKKN